MVDLGPKPHQDLNLVQLILKLQVVRIVLDLNLHPDHNLVTKQLLKLQFIPQQLQFTLQ
jgi:hypothetical protein